MSPPAVDNLKTGKVAIIAEFCDESNDSAQAQKQAGQKQEQEFSILEDENAPEIYFAHQIQQECITGQETQLASATWLQKDRLTDRFFIPEL